MKIAVFSAKPYDRIHLEAANAEHGHELVYFEAHLVADTAVLAAGFPVVCAFVNDHLDREVVLTLAAGGTRLIALRSAGFNHVDLAAAAEAGVTVARVPAYSPYAVAEHAVALILTLNRKMHRSYHRVREGNFALNGLCGFDLNGRTVGVVGTGKIGEVFARIMQGFGCEVLAFDPKPNAACRERGVAFVSLEELLQRSDIVSLHCPLSDKNHHLIDAERLAMMKPGVMLINTSRGALVDTRAAIEALKRGHLGHLGVDVYEEEEALFFEDLSSEIIRDDVFMRLLTFPNVIVTAHQAFFTEEALHNIAATTLGNVTAFESGKGSLHAVTAS
ncbi:2-hydroxyacid dehydrogenase [Haliangium ochraceum]|uniref:D-isomer specific 2-hydroxyacid dehydrogenase NAD-binding protein n=1 Tax=Haliangium ochraceum (strain DSM 14365 / JCM 11303 / SMP-2) TaxID=502025 RepID=D0LXZ3_HALO1|nr:2-hydroxyacid dehydrogenase [Haliangium ochraceum]ACY14348.1 D-isomer specific 2-hydroxyacid dehydrogenase NAD-binding protein [Haliangium ochraceum DSM 14365]